ncbi:selenoneine biosynthesis selenosugar synthase SenB [Undibacterium arcticum]
MTKIHIIIISPASAKANNGNWQTASRWAHFLRAHYRVTLMTQWDRMPCDLMIALHARRSAVSIAAFAAAHPTLPLVLVLTGTDLYRDIRHDADAQRSLQLATRLIVLQEAGLDELKPAVRNKARVIHQSARPLTPLDRSAATRHFDVVTIGHLRDEKDPLTFMRAAALVASPSIRLWQIGGALTPALQDQAELTQNQHRRYRWLGNMPHAATRQRLKRSHLMIITSIMEGGANVIIEAITSGVPVLASDIPGNRGMLGDDYAGYFPVGDSPALAALVERALADPTFYARLQQRCAARAPLFFAAAGTGSLTPVSG